MSKIKEYVDAALGYDSNGLPASTVQITFGYAPFSVAETENIGDLTTIQAICQLDAAVDITIVDNFLKLSIDFGVHTQEFGQFAEEYKMYKAQLDHVTETLNDLMLQYEVANENQDVKKAEDLQIEMRKLSIPFMIPALLPIVYTGSVQVSFSEDPKFTFFESENLNAAPTRVTMIYDANSLFAQDELGIVQEAYDDFEAQREELWYMEESKKLEEAMFQAQYGYSAMQEEDNSEQKDKKLKGIKYR